METYKIGINFDLSKALAQAIEAKNTTSCLNALRAAQHITPTDGQNELLYCEGWVTDNHGRSIKHCWLETEGEIIDPTPAFHLYPFRLYVSFLRLPYKDLETEADTQQIDLVTLLQKKREGCQGDRQQTYQCILELSDYSKLFTQKHNADT
jgi:hypothetical protein